MKKELLDLKELIIKEYGKEYKKLFKSNLKNDITITKVVSGVTKKDIKNVIGSALNLVVPNTDIDISLVYKSDNYYYLIDICDYEIENLTDVKCKNLLNNIISLIEDNINVEVF